MKDYCAARARCRIPAVTTTAAATDMAASVVSIADDAASVTTVVMVDERTSLLRWASNYTADDEMSLDESSGYGACVDRSEVGGPSVYGCSV